MTVGDTPLWRATSRISTLGESSAQAVCGLISLVAFLLSWVEAKYLIAGGFESGAGDDLLGQGDNRRTHWPRLRSHKASRLGNSLFRRT